MPPTYYRLPIIGIMKELSWTVLSPEGNFSLPPLASRSSLKVPGLIHVALRIRSTASRMMHYGINHTNR